MDNALLTALERAARGLAIAALALAPTSCAAIAGIDDLVLRDGSGGAPSKDVDTFDGSGGSGEGGARPDASDDGAMEATDSSEPTDRADDAHDGAGGDADGRIADRFATDAQDASSNQDVDAGQAACPAGRGPSMVRVPTIDGQSYCIDSTEVTQSQYSQFLLAKQGNTSGQESRCTWNTSYAPMCPTFDPVGKASYPVVCVDWCDAVAFCSWAGKRLCGKIGGGSLVSNDANDVSKDQRFSACTHSGRQSFPYPGTQNAAYCVFLPQSNNVMAPVASDSHCVGGYPGLYDMLGNAQEWEDACDTNDAGVTRCLVRGGDYRDMNFDCSESFAVIRTEYPDWVGFRCCAD